MCHILVNSEITTLNRKVMKSGLFEFISKQWGDILNIMNITVNSNCVKCCEEARQGL